MLQHQRAGLQEANGVSLFTRKIIFTSASCIRSELLGMRELYGEVGLTVMKPLSMFVYSRAARPQLNTEDSMSSAGTIL